MSAGENAGADMIDWYVEPDRSGADRHGSLRIRRGEERANSLALIITISLLFVLLASALMVGGHAVVGPLFRATRSGQEQPNSVGDIVYTMPDGVFCRHLSFDNETGTITQGTLVHCAGQDDRSTPLASTAFKWGTR